MESFIPLVNGRSVSLETHRALSDAFFSDTGQVRYVTARTDEENALSFEKFISE